MRLQKCWNSGGEYVEWTIQFDITFVYFLSFYWSKSRSISKPGKSWDKPPFLLSARCLFLLQMNLIISPHSSLLLFSTGCEFYINFELSLTNCNPHRRICSTHNLRDERFPSSKFRSVYLYHARLLRTSQIHYRGFPANLSRNAVGPAVPSWGC
jgi:hypothetical protein